MLHTKIVHSKKEKILTSNAEKFIKDSKFGASIYFLGTVRNINDNKLAIQLAKKALAKDPKYVNYDYRKEQLWGEKLQATTEILLQNEQLKEDVILAKSKISESS